ncbi:MAG: Hpt domain-containing protein [Desulfuromonadales bacterium]
MKTDEPAEPATILDQADALRRVGDDRELFKALLDDFLDSYGAAGEALAVMCARGEWENARFLVHAVRGAAANLGMVRIYAVARTLEDALKRGDGEVSRTLQFFNERLRELREYLLTNPL